MARKDALLLLHEQLKTRRDDLRKKVGDQDSFATPDPGNGTGDVGDAANNGSQSELNSQLAALESRELAQIEQAIQSIREGRYGSCEFCGSSIPITRLKALPYSTSCIECQRQEEAGELDRNDLSGNWESVSEHEGRMNDREISLRDLDVE